MKDIIIDSYSVAAILGVSYDTVRRMKPGELPKNLPSDGKKMWRLKDIVNHARAQNEKEYLENKNRISRVALKIESEV